MNESYFSSDWHKDHERSLRFFARRSFETHKQCEELIENKAFAKMKPGSNFYYVGDLRWNSTKEVLDNFFKEFKKRKINFHWILGNHDKLPSGYSHSALTSVSQIKNIEIQKQKITLCHFPMISWEKSHYNAWHLHGHIHYNDSSYRKMEPFVLDRNPFLTGKILNVNIELHDWEVWSFEEVFEYMSLQNNNWDLMTEEDRR